MSMFPDVLLPGVVMDKIGCKATYLAKLRDSGIIVGESQKTRDGKVVGWLYSAASVEKFLAMRESKRAKKPSAAAKAS